ncbi:MAG: hypothetical protein AAF990_05040 [Bacteroidota bacterium]
MLSIFATTEYIDDVHAIVQSIDRLSELVSIYDSFQHAPTAAYNSLMIDHRGILCPIDWQNGGPPYLLPAKLAFQKEVLLGLIFARLGNMEWASNHLSDHTALLAELETVHRLFNGGIVQLPATASSSDAFENYRTAHNTAILQHYGQLEQPADLGQIRDSYAQALAAAPNSEHRAYTVSQFATLLLDAGEVALAEKMLSEAVQEAISEEARHKLQTILTQAWMKQLTVPYDQKLLERLKNTLWESLQFYERNDRQAEMGLLLLDAAHIANISDSFSESLGYISRAERIFEAQEMIELQGSTHLRKGTLLYTWAQKGNPQFYKPALEAYQRALKIFRQEVAPDIFADIHHNLAILYAEMPAEQKKRGIWAGISATSFQEALNYYTKENFPYQYGMICNNFGNALMKFPAAIHSDNYEKALFYYQEALDVRTANVPYERSITLLNFLEASWNVSNAQETFNEDRYKDMLTKAEEIQTLVEDADMLAEAQKHLALLKELKETVSR